MHLRMHRARGIGRCLEFEVAATMDYTQVAPYKHDVSTNPGRGLYLWQGNGIVLMGQQEHECFILARGWIENDRLVHVRRWKFSTPERFSGQVRRLVKEASGDYQLAANERRVSLNSLGSTTEF